MRSVKSRDEYELIETELTQKGVAYSQMPSMHRVERTSIKCDLLSHTLFFVDVRQVGQVARDGIDQVFDT